MSDTSSVTWTSSLNRYLRAETVGGSLLLVAAAIALIWINSPFGDSYTALRDFEIGPEFLHLHLSLGTWAKDGLLAVFFFVAGLELKRELVIGELADRRKAILPVIAACGGVLLPALIAAAVGWGTPGMDRGWAIPVATDIAFALGVLALTGSRIPTSARVFLLSLAVVDDLIGIALIAILFTSGLALGWMLATVAAAAAYWFAQKKRITTPWLYVPLALFTWYAMHSAGIHATVAGVLLGLLTRVRTDPGEDYGPAERLAHRLQPWSAGLCVPIFALFASGVPIGAEMLGNVFTDPVGLAIVLGLLVGKTVGIFGSTWVAIRFRVATKPTGLQWGDVLALAVLGAIGFTVSLLITELSLTGEAAEIAKAAVLVTSLIASLLGSALLLRRGRAHRQRNEPTEGVE
ncbi:MULTISPECIES: Na+/H+ antiporter NhaA [Rhodococcus]|uniref:Na(+)/H(+) antiporter NhaA n=1 Tax=Rhodococcus rhodochrous TaxID=1829 RepID=A0AAW4XN80_RHORH|nr:MULTISPECIES: Na+/H+ antiporter NhaA [Rhodococcus]MCD2114532.1 Na+/H+ antiporter NhaA [Rhodococcus rhodochrous]QHG84786.1 Na+/H+ antiporter NhaA [Rhodococcus rhodochrous]QOH58906.1 Na+/H+ antiporter NhaA [Rhodococcus rhodochrous]WAL46955.1 Na+/H+ antiporter NhaA [Rhodococcus pyridinivorans]